MTPATDSIATETPGLDARHAQARAETGAEARTARTLFVFALAVIVSGMLGLALWGLPALAMLGLAATVLVFAMLAAYAAGF